MSFANPYNFVAIDEGKIERQSYERQGEYNGKIKCHMRFLSNFITAGINKDREKKQLRINEEIGIQASSLKGLLRATAEAISNSCISVMSKKYGYRFMRGMPIGISSSSGVEYKKEFKNGNYYLVFDHSNLVNKDALIDSCDNKKGLCICCRLFGTTAKEDKEKEESFSFKGKIRISDAEYLGVCDKSGHIIKEKNPIITKYLKRHSLSSPKNHHEGFYLNDNKIKGRKFYYHHQGDTLFNKKQDDAILVELVKKDAVFEFTISFENLTEEEYGLLLTTLELEHGLGHKLGMGKPLGLGSCAIEIKEIKEFTKNRFLSIDSCGEIFNEKKGNILAKKELIKKWWKKGIPEDLKCILTLNNGFTVRYPDRSEGEFKKPLHKPCEDFSGRKINLPKPPKLAPCNPTATNNLSAQQVGGAKIYGSEKRHGSIGMEKGEH